MSLELRGTRKKGDKGGLETVVGAFCLIVGIAAVSGCAPTEFGKLSVGLF